MASLLRLPSELLEQVYHRLGSIDDVNHFSRASKKTYEAIRSPSVYVKVMRSIIGSAPQHRYEIFLCGMLQLHRDIVAHFKQQGLNSTLRFAAQPNQVQPRSFEAQLLTIASNECLRGPCIECLPDDRICEILARYRGLRTLEHEWLLRPLSSNDLLAVEHSMGIDRLVRNHQILKKQHEEFKDGALLENSWDSLESRAYTNFNPDQRARFHAALTAVWTMNEIRWVFTQFTSQRHHAVSPVQLQLLDACMASFRRKTSIPVVDEADQYAMWQFLYQHLLPLYGSFLADRDCYRLPLTFPSKFAGDPHGTRMFQLFLLTGQTYMQPPDLIDLILRHQTSRKRPFPELRIPRSTRFYQRPSKEYPFRVGVYHPFGGADRRDQTAIIHLNIISRATIHQSLANPFTRWARPSLENLFVANDESAAFFRERMIARFEEGATWDFRTQEKFDKIRRYQKQRWGDIWWEVWWWANSEDKARAKIERWVPIRLPDA